VYIFHALKHSEREKMKMEQAEMQSPTTGSAGVENLQAEETREPAPAAEPTAENGDLAELKAQAAKAKEHWDLLLRTTADFDNFKKRAARERQDAIRYANESLLQKLIPVLDSFDMAANATAAVNSTEGANQSLQAGVSMILTQLRSALAESGLEEIEAANKPFDPNFHEAVAQQETGDVPEGHVVQQLRKGYKLRDRLLRPATVVVAKKPAA
jgi:molecular chaperone GrpE